MLKGSARHLESQGGLRQFDYLMLNLPFECNYSCLKCCNSTEQRNIRREASNLDADEIKSIIKKARGCGARVLAIAGEGEPLLNKHFKEIVSHACKAGLIPYIFTNGSLLNGEMCKFLHENNASLIINIDSLKENAYGELTGTRGAFKKLMKNLKTCRKIFSEKKENFGGCRIVRLAINTVATAKNYREIPAIKRFCRDDIAFVCNAPIGIGAARKNACKLINDECALREIENVSSASFPLGSTHNGGDCCYLRNGIGVGSDGSLIPCAYALDTMGTFANIRQNKGLLEAKKEIAEKIENFFSENGHHRCLLRHPQYQKLAKNILKGCEMNG